MARGQSRTYLEETISDAEISDDLELFPPLAPISGAELSQHTLPQVWEEGTSSVGKVMGALAASKGRPIPWNLIVAAVSNGLSNNLFEITKESPRQPWAVDDADKIGLQISQVPVTIDLTDFTAVMQQSLDESGQPTLGWIKERLESRKGVSIPDDLFRDAVQKAVDHQIITLVDPLTDDLYHIRVKRPSWIGHTESHLTDREIQDLSETSCRFAWNRA